MFFSFLAVFPLPESYQNDPKFHFNTLLRSDTQKSSKNVENTTVFWSRCETVFGVWSRCETVFGPPPAKADIATAILTNVIEHLVLLLPPNKHAFTAKAVWADFLKKCMFNLDMFFLEKHAWTAWKDAEHFLETAEFAAGNCTHVCSISNTYFSRNINYCGKKCQIVCCVIHIILYIYMVACATI